MVYIVLSLLLLVAAVAVWTTFRGVEPRWVRPALTMVLALFSLLSAAMTSYVKPAGDEIALLERVYLCSSIKGGRNIALDGECGRQAEVIMPGFHLRPFIRVLNNVHYVKMVDVKSGTYATLVAKDGIQLEPGQVAAKPWPKLSGMTVDQSVRKMLDATFFLTDGKGRKGLQTTVLRPGRYPVNLFLFDVQTGNPVTTIPPGHVGVIKSSIDEDVVPMFMPNAGKPVDCSKKRKEDLGHLSAVLVPVGCRGVWREPLPPGTYFINSHVYEVHVVDTRIRNWVYKGGYQRHAIRVRISPDGQITQERSETTNIPVPKTAAGSAIRIKVEGWNVVQEVRIQARVSAERAPLVVAAIGGLDEVEDRIITPQVRSVLRNIGGSRIRVKNRAAYEEAKSELASLKSRLHLLKDKDAVPDLTPEQRAKEIAELERKIAGFRLPDPEKEIVRPTRVLDFQDNREALERLAEEKIREIGEKAGVNIVSVRFGDVYIPPELLVARKLEQLSGQLEKAYVRMRMAQVQRQATEAAKARADKQGQLVQAAIDVETSKRQIESEHNKGVAQRRRDEEIAKGRKALAEVLGPDRVMQIQLAERLMETIAQNPEIVKGLLQNLSNLTVVNGGGSGIPALGAIMSNSPLFTGKSSGKQPVNRP